MFVRSLADLLVRSVAVRHMQDCTTARKGVLREQTLLSVKLSRVGRSSALSSGVMYSDPVSELDPHLTSSPVTDTSYGAGVEPRRRRREISSGNPEKAKCIKCGRVPHRRCEHNLCPRCCNVVVKNCPVHIKKSETRRGLPSKHLDSTRNVAETIEVYRNELESLRRRYRWFYERKQLADEQELQQSIRRYKENANWLSEVFNSDTLDPTDSSIEENPLSELRGQDLLDRCEAFLNQDLSPCKDSTSTSPEILTKTRRGRKKIRKGVTSSSHQWITPVVVPDAEWTVLLERASSKVPRHL